MSHELPNTFEENIRAQHAEVETAFAEEGIDSQSRANLSTWSEGNLQGPALEALNKLK